MTVLRPPSLELPFMLHGFTGGTRRKVEAQGRQWAQQYLATGGFTSPQTMRQVPPGEPLLMHEAAEFDFLRRSSWRVHMFGSVFMSLHDSVSKEVYPLIRESFETFCLDTPWGALYHAVSPPPVRSAERMASRFTALLRFWDILQGPRYAFQGFGNLQTLDELIRDIYQVTLEAWCPGPFTSVREQLAQVAQRMAHATREDSIEAMLLVIPHLLHSQPKLPHREVLGNPDFVRARLAETSPGDFEDASGADRFRVNGLLHAWSRALSRR